MRKRRKEDGEENATVVQMSRKEKARHRAKEELRVHCSLCCLRSLALRCAVVLGEQSGTRKATGCSIISEESHGPARCCKETKRNWILPLCSVCQPTMSITYKQRTVHQGAARPRNAPARRTPRPPALAIAIDQGCRLVHPASTRSQRQHRRPRRGHATAAPRRRG